MKYFKKVIGERCYLSPINLSDAAQYCEWLNDFEISKNLMVNTQMLQEDNERNILSGIIDRKDYVFAIVLKGEDKLIGNTGIHKINHIDRKCDVGIFIGDKDHLSKGYGTEAMNLTLDFAFNILNMHNVMLEVFAYNKRAIHSYEKCGFKVIGSRRESKEICGKRHDIVFMDILREEFKSPYFEKEFNK
jgi:RimJ/RimL family protein N-acetyltransferase